MRMRYVAGRRKTRRDDGYTNTSEYIIVTSPSSACSLPNHKVNKPIATRSCFSVAILVALSYRPHSEIAITDSYESELSTKPLSAGLPWISDEK